MLYLLATPIGNIADITFRAIEVLESCDIVLCEDTRVSTKLIRILNERGMLRKSHFTYISLHSHNETKVSHFEADFFKNDIIFMSDAGMPCVSDPGAKLVQFAQNNKIPYTIIPGASSMISAFAMSGFESKEYTFLSFLPHKQSEKIALLHRICHSQGLYICFESPHRLLDTLNILADISSDTRIFAIKEMTKLHEKYYFGNVKSVQDELSHSNINGEWVLIIQGKDSSESTLSKGDILGLQIPPKIKAKILSKLTGKSIDECYDEILRLKMQ